MSHETDLTPVRRFRPETPAPLRTLQKGFLVSLARCFHARAPHGLHPKLFHNHLCPETV